MQTISNKIKNTLTIFFQDAAWEHGNTKQKLALYLAVTDQHLYILRLDENEETRIIGSINNYKESWRNITSDIWNLHLVHALNLQT